MLSVFLFSIALKKRILIFFFVFRFRMEFEKNGLQVVFCSTRNRRTKSLFKTSSNAAILVSLQSKYSARSAYYSRMTFMNRERIVLFVSNFLIELEYLNHPTVALFETSNVDCTFHVGIYPNW